MRRTLLDLFKGALIGTGAILPGISGGVLCVALGIYPAMMSFLTHPLPALRQNSRFLLSILTGFVLGVMGLSRLVDWLFRASPMPAVWLFVGLIAGSLPALWRDAGREGRSLSALISGGTALVLMLALLLFLRSHALLQSTPTVWTWLLCGVLWGIGLIAPGMSPSSLFLFMGVYQPMAAGIADFSLPILLPMGIGLLICVLTLSRFMSLLLHRFPAETLHALLGAAIASTLMILPLGAFPGWWNAILYALCFAVGLLAALWLEKLGSRDDA